MVTDKIEIEMLIKGDKKAIANIDAMKKRVQATKDAFTFNTQKNPITNWAKQGSEGLIGFNGAALSTLFLGMQLQKTFGAALTAIFDGYKKAQPEGSKFNEMTNKLSANWEFFKFQLADALTQSPMFQKFIAFTITLIQWFQKLPEPIKAATVALIAFTAALGVILFTTSTIKLGLAGLIDGMGGLGLATGSFKWGAVAKVGWITAAVALVATFYKAWDTFANSSYMANEKSKIFTDGMKDTLNSVITPLTEAFGLLNFSLGSLTEVFVFVGAQVQNVINVYMMLADVIIFVIRVISNFIQLALDPAIETMKTFASVLGNLFEGDFAGAIGAARSHVSNLTNSMKTDFMDISNAFNTMTTNIDKKSTALVDPFEAVNAYREQLKQNSVLDLGGDINPLTGDLLLQSTSPTQAEKATQIIVLQNTDELAQFTPEAEKVRDILGIGNVNPNTIN